MMMKYLQSIALLLAVLLSLAANGQSVYGDVNGDGEVNISDISAIIDIILSI